MTIKEYNKLRTAVFDVAMQIPDIADAVNTSGTALVYELHQLPDKREVIVLTQRTQLHDNLLRSHGFNPAETDVILKLKLNAQTKCADF